MRQRKKVNIMIKFSSPSIQRAKEFNTIKYIGQNLQETKKFNKIKSLSHILQMLSTLNKSLILNPQETSTLKLLKKYTLFLWSR
jgi:hypothetical protein